MENQKNEYNLVNGTFTRTETREILVTLFRDKIRFHSQKNFSHEERFGKPDIKAQERIPILKSTLEEVLKFLEQYHNESGFEIHADIIITPVSNV